MDDEYMLIHPPKRFGGNPMHTRYVGPRDEGETPGETTETTSDMEGQAQPSDLPQDALGIDELEKGR